MKPRHRRDERWGCGITVEPSGHSAALLLVVPSVLLNTSELSPDEKLEPLDLLSLLNELPEGSPAIVADG